MSVMLHVRIGRRVPDRGRQLGLPRNRNPIPAWSTRLTPPQPPIQSASPPDPALGTHAASEADLVRRLKAGEDAAYEEFVRSLTGRLLAVARRISRTEADAEDAVQDAFLSAFKSIGSFDGRSTLSTWMHRIVVNAALMKVRSAKTHKAVSIDALLPAFEDGLHKEHPKAWRTTTGHDGLINEEERAAVLSALDALPEEFREVIMMRDVEGLESKSVAAALNISDALVRQRLHRGRQALLTLLNERMTEVTP